MQSASEESPRAEAGCVGNPAQVHTKLNGDAARPNQLGIRVWILFDIISKVC